MSLLSLIIIGILIYKIVECNDYIKKLERQVKMLKERVKVLENNSANTSDSYLRNNIENVKEEAQITNMENPEYVVRSMNVPKNHQEKKIVKNMKTDGRNVAILTVGAVFIVVAAISFLYAGWDVLPNVLKSAVLSILAIMFFGMSNVAKKVFKLPQTSKTFYYIALGYVPIVLFSFSLFGLVGEFFSIQGEGKFIYLALTNFIVMFVYLLLGVKNSDIRLYYAGNIMQIISVIFSTLIFTAVPENVIAVLLLYSTLINYSYGKLNIKFKEESIKFAEVLTFITAIIGVFSLPAVWGMWLSVLYTLTLVFNSILLYRREDSEIKEIFVLLSTFLLVLVCINLKINEHSLLFVAQEIILILYVLVSSYIYNFKLHEKVIRPMGNILNTIIMVILLFAVAESCLPVWLVATLSFLIASIVYLKGKKEGNALYIITLVLGYIALLLHDSGLTYLVTILQSIFATLILTKNNGKFIKLVPILAFLPKLYTHELMVGNEFDLAILLNLAIIVIFTIINFKRRDVSLVIASFVYLYGLLGSFDFNLNDYVVISIFIIWGIVQLFSIDNKARDWIRVFIYTNGLIMYMLLIHDLKINDITCIFMLGILVYAYAIIRGIIRKYNKESYKVYEYLTYAIVYIWAFELYSSALDITLFLAMILAIIVISYMKKMGPAFLCSMVAIVTNMFYLSRSFWLNIPWWVYLVVVGGILITFAVRNEVSEKRENIDSFKDKLAKAKEFLDI